MHQPDLAAFAEQAGLGAAQIHVLGLVSAQPGWSRHDGRFLYPASMIKVPLAVAVTLAIAAARLAWDTPVVVDPSNATVNDAPSPIEPGHAPTALALTTLLLPPPPHG